MSVTVTSVEKSEDSVRRALKRGTAEEWDAWLTVQERAVYEPLLSEPYVLDIDNTVQPLYGHQEGAEPVSSNGCEERCSTRSLRTIRRC